MKQFVFKNPFYKVLVDEEQTKIQFLDLDDNCIIPNVLHNLQIENTVEQNEIQDVSLDTFNVRIENTSSGIKISMVGEGEFQTLTISFMLSSNTPEIKVEIQTNYKKKIAIVRESIILQLEEGVSQIFTKNAKSIKENFSDHYWIGKQGGVVFGKGTRSMFINNAPMVSSLEVKSIEQELWVNLDLSMDHPFINPDPDGIWQDRSNSRYDSRKSRENKFSFYVGKTPSLLPRIMKTPHGFLSTYVWTEHACNGDLKTKKAVYFGSEDIDSVKNAIGGFAKHNIPVTQSVFYANSDKTKIQTSELFKDEMLAVKSNKDFFAFLKELHSTGLYEICLHCPQPTTSSLKVVEEALDFMKKQFDIVTWIDHLAYTEKEISGSMESFSCYGMHNNKKDYYIASIWEKYDVKYFWNHALEYIDRIPKRKDSKSENEFKKLSGPDITNHPIKNLFIIGKGYAKSLMLQRPMLILIAKKIMMAIKLIKKSLRYTRNVFVMKQKNQKISNWTTIPLIVGTIKHLNSSEDLPNSIYWRHPTITADFYSWGTYLTRGYYFNRGDKVSDWAKKLCDFSESWGVFIHHAYPGRAKDTNGCWEVDNYGKVVVSKEFDQCLALMESFQSEKKIYFTTIRDIMDYWLKLENIEMDFSRDDDVIRISNWNKTRVQGITFVTTTHEIYVGGKEPNIRQVNGETVFWFDLGEMQYTTISSSVLTSMEQGQLNISQL